jgi:membrane protein implicated in regulation of membrane protease activity
MMAYLYLASFLVGLLLAVRLMFFGAERRRRWSGSTPLRRSEPAIVAFLFALGISGYTLTRRSSLSPMSGLALSALIAAVWAAIVTWLAILASRIQPEHDPDDPRYVLRGRVGVVTIPIPEKGNGMIQFQDADSHRTLAARSLDGTAIAAEQEVCIERIEGEVAFVELWSLVEERL